MFLLLGCKEALLYHSD
uniref:Uncharacterized protein n=1 Tax=Anguilla anguilla TaxID=7936 RepID=A0A0E9T862_ANGAN